MHTADACAHAAVTSDPQPSTERPLRTARRRWTRRLAATLKSSGTGQKRSNDTHASTTDPEARLYRKSNNTAARLCYAGHLLMEHRSALIVDAELGAATGYAERDCAARDARPAAGLERGGARSAGDKGYDTRDFVAQYPTDLEFTPHVAPNTTNRRSAIDGRTTRHAGPPRSANGSANGSRNPSAGSRPSAAAANSATSAATATGPGSRSPPPSTT